MPDPAGAAQKKFSKLKNFFRCQSLLLVRVETGPASQITPQSGCRPCLDVAQATLHPTRRRHFPTPAFSRPAAHVACRSRPLNQFLFARSPQRNTRQHEEQRRRKPIDDTLALETARIDRFSDELAGCESKPTQGGGARVG